MRLRYLLLFLLAGCSAGSGTAAIREFNDFFTTGGNTDKNFTQGLDLTYSSGSGDGVLANASSYLPSFSTESPDVDNATLTVGQKLYTPENLAATELQENDNPYAGWLYTSLTRHSKLDDVYLDTSLSLGVVGPLAQGEEIQSWFHRLCDCQEPMGWDNQLKNEPALMLTHTRRWMVDQGIMLGSTDWGMMTEVEFRVGNVHTDYTYTRTIMLGEFDSPNKSLSCYAFLKAGSSFIGRNIFYDGNTFQDSHRVNKEYIVGFVTPGLHITYRGIGIEFSWVNRTKDYDEQLGDVNSYGAITLGFVPRNFMESDQ